MISPDADSGNGADAPRQRVHTPVLLAETLQLLGLKPGAVVVDGTVGAGGHALSIARAIAPGGVLLGLDRDSEILAFARRTLAAAAADLQVRIELFHLVSSEMQQALAAVGQDGCDAVLLDLGVSSLQLDQPGRGFSFMADGPLDMRMDTTAGPTAADWLASVSEVELARVLFEYGDERHSRRIARGVVAARKATPLRRTGQLAELVLRALPPAARHGRIHPATRTFQAIRMQVNDELGNLQRALAAASACLRPGGRLAVIAFHSAEDRLVKQFVREWLRPLHKKPVMAGEAEVAQNPRARSARLRVAERTEVA